MSSIISCAVAGSAQRAILFSRISNRWFKSVVSRFGDSICPTADTWAKISIPCCLSYFTKPSVDDLMEVVYTMMSDYNEQEYPKLF